LPPQKFLGRVSLKESAAELIGSEDNSIENRDGEKREFDAIEKR
jgi:hypothetical protein